MEADEKIHCLVIVGAEGSVGSIGREGGGDQALVIHDCPFCFSWD